MKKIVFLLLTMFIAFGSFAQKSKITSAILDLQDGKPDEAIEKIEIGIQDEKAAADPKSWYTRGRAYLMVYENRNQYPELSKGALDKAYESFMKVLELDSKYKENDKIILLNLPYIKAAYAVEGDVYRDQKDFKKAYEMYTKATELNQFLLKQTDKERIDTGVVFLRGYSAEKSGDIPTAELVYNELVNLKYELTLLYQLAAKIYIDQEKYDEALRIIKAGQALFPNNNDLVIDELNIYLSTGKQEEAIDRFKAAIALDPKNADLYFALGTIYDKLKDKAGDTKEQAEQYKSLMVDAYVKAIENDPMHFKANYNLGVVYFNEAVEISKEMNNLPLNAKKEYEDLKKKRNDLFAQAQPYLEKAHQSNPEDRDTMKALKEIYFRTGDQAKYNEINEKLKS